MPVPLLKELDVLTFLGKVVDREKSKNKGSKKKASRMAKAVVQSNKSAEQEKKRYGGHNLPW